VKVIAHLSKGSNRDIIVNGKEEGKENGKINPLAIIQKKL